MSLFSFLSHKKKKDPKPPLPSWDEIVSVMYNKQLNRYVDEEVVDVLYAPDRAKRFVLLRSNKGYFKYCYEEIHPFTEEEWMYVSGEDNLLPAIWETPGSWQGTSLYASLEDTWKELKLSPEYKLFFENHKSSD